MQFQPLGQRSHAGLGGLQVVLFGHGLQLDERADHWPPDEAIEQIYQMWKEASVYLGIPVALGCEKVACQTLVGTGLRFRAQADGVQLPKVEMRKKAKGMNKDVNIRQSFGAPLGNRRWYLRAGLLLPRIETRNFPTGSKDWLDTAAQVMQKYNELLGVKRQGSTANRKRRKAVRHRRITQAGAGGV